MIELTVRLIASLAIVLGLLLVTVRVAGRRFRTRAGAPLRVVHRQALSRSSAVTVVEVGSRVLVLGSTEHQINLLAELDPEELEDPDLALPIDEADVLEMPAPTRIGAHRAAPRTARTSTSAATGSGGVRSARPGTSGALGGSVLSPQTWRQAFAAARGQA